MSQDLYLVELTVWDPALGATKVLRYASGQGHITGPAETPPNAFYEPRVLQPAGMTRTLFAARTTQGRSTVGFGDLVLQNDDGALDGLLAYGFDGRSIMIRRGLVDAAYPGGFTTDLVATMAGAPEITQQTVTVKLRDRQAELALPLQLTKYLGDNALPAGLEGVAGDLKGKPKPICLGSAQNVSPPCVNTSKLIYQVHDGAVASVPAVYDKGVALGAGFGFTQQTSQFGAHAIRAAAYGAAVFVIVGEDGDCSYSADNGATWTLVDAQFGTSTIEDVYFGGGQFVAVGAGGKISTSPDGITWTAQTSGSAGSFFGICYDGSGLWVAVGAAGQLYSSPTAVTWTSRTSGFGAAIIYTVGYGNGLWIAGGAGGLTTVSSDGITWAAATIYNFLGSIIYGVVYLNSTFFGIGSAGRLSTTQSGVAWITRTSGFAGNIYDMAWSGTLYVAVGNTGTIGYSLDGITWVQGTSGFGADPISAIAYGNGVFVIGGSAGLVACSSGLVYANTTDLQDDTLAPPPGTFGVCLTSGYLRLGSTPAGLVTADVLQGDAAADRTAAQLFKAALARKGYTAADWVAADLTALDAANAAVCGDWVNEERAVGVQLDAIAGSVLAAWWVDKAGHFRIRQFVAPASAPVLYLTENDLVRPLVRVPMNDPGQGIPVYQSILDYGRNFTVQATDLAGAVTDERRAWLAADYRQAKATDAAVQTAHLLAPQTEEATLLQVEADAQTEANRRQTLRGVDRDCFEAPVPLNAETAVADLGDVVNLVHSRFGLAVGADLLVLGVAPDCAKRELLLTLWG